QVILWHAQTGQMIRKLLGHRNIIEDVSFSADGQYILSVAEDESARLWEASTGRLIREFHVATNYQTARGAISPDNKLIVTCWYNEVFLWYASTVTLLRNLVNNAYNIRHLEFTHDGKGVLIAGLRVVEMYDLEANQIKFELDNTENSVFVRGATVSPDDSTVIISVDNRLTFVDAQTGGELRRITDLGLLGPVVMSHNAKYILVGGDVARLFDTQTGKLLRTFSGHKDYVSAVAFSPDDKYILTGSYDTTVQLSDTDYLGFITFACSRVTRDFSKQERAQYN